MNRTYKTYSNSTTCAVLDFIIQTEIAATSNSGSTVYFDIEDLISQVQELPTELQDLVAEAESLECKVMELYL